MVFSSMVFLCVFLPAVFCAHLLLPGVKAKNVLLILASLSFYAYGEPVYLILLIISSFLNYFLACLIDCYPLSKKIWMSLSVLWNLGLLIIFKYMGLIIGAFNRIAGTAISDPGIRMPVGISFFTFQAMSYVIDVFRGTVKSQKNYGKVLLYISFFPQLIAGPIVKYHDVELEINSRKLTLEGTSRGIRRFTAGLCKKVLIANTMGLAADILFEAPLTQINGLGVWIGAVSYMLQIYFDFSGYSDMAIGLGWMFGFHFRENFEYPYIAASMREFWRRWHISLTSWFREYLYIPLGGNRKGKWRTVVNKIIVFMLTGIWHGASLNFLFWGVYHGFFQMLEEYIPAIGSKGGHVKTFFQHIYVLLTVCVGFVFFRADSMSQGLFWVKEMFTGLDGNDAAMSLAIQQLTPVYFVTVSAAVIASLPVKRLWKGMEEFIVRTYVMKTESAVRTPDMTAVTGRYRVNVVAFQERIRKKCEILTYMMSFAGFLLCVLKLAGDTYNPFIYFRF